MNIKSFVIEVSFGLAVDCIPKVREYDSKWWLECAREEANVPATTTLFRFGQSVRKRSGRVMRKDWIAVVGMLSVLDGYRAEIRRHYERCVVLGFY